MGFKKPFMMLSVMLFSVSVYADQNIKIEGVYDKLTGHKFSFDGKQVEIIEFFSFYCNHCYQFETPSLIIAGNLKTNPGMLDHNIDFLRDNAITILKSMFKK
jgi:hypothetical protein